MSRIKLLVESSIRLLEVFGSDRLISFGVATLNSNLDLTEAPLSF